MLRSWEVAVGKRLTGPMTKRSKERNSEPIKNSDGEETPVGGGASHRMRADALAYGSSTARYSTKKKSTGQHLTSAGTRIRAGTEGQSTVVVCISV